MTDLAILFKVEGPERIARLRGLRTAARLLCGPRGRQLERCLYEAERDAGAIPAAMACLEGLSPLDRRRLLTTFAATLRHPCERLSRTPADGLTFESTCHARVSPIGTGQASLG